MINLKNFKILQQKALFVTFILMSLKLIFHININHLWILIPFLTYITFLGILLVLILGGIIFSCIFKGSVETINILKTNNIILREATDKKYNSLENTIQKLWYKQKNLDNSKK